MQLSKSIVFDNIINKKAIQYLGKKKYSKKSEFLFGNHACSFNKKRLGTHPEVIELFWNDKTREIPEKCQAVLFGTPVLINPNNGIIFGIAEGSYPALLRVHQEQISIIIGKGGKLTLSNINGIYADASQLGDGWIYCFYSLENIEIFFLEAFNYSNNM